MKSTDPTRRPVLLLGRDHEEYGRVSVVPVSEHTACAISPGADAEFAEKTQKVHVNEDALLVLEDARHTVACVADAHFGREASEELVARLAEALDPVPENPERLAAVMRQMAGVRTRSSARSASSLVICILDRMFRQAFGLSYGDSSVVHVVPGELPQRENRPTISYVSPFDPASLAPENAEPFAFSPGKGDLILVFTDGVDECCYRDPDRSVTPEAMHAVVARSDHEPETVARDLARLALTGVDGHPGGQDNVALIATRT